MSQPRKAEHDPDGREAAGSKPAALDPLREQIDQIDQQVVELLARRRRVVQEVAEIKQQHDLPLYHPAREENLISARRAQAVNAGLDPDFVEDIFRTMMRYSRAKQLDTLSRRSVRPGAKVLIVGGRGNMGTFLARWLTQSDYEVRILDREDWPQAPELTTGIDLALLAVPIDLTPAVALQLGPFLPKDCVLADITSLKREPLAAMLHAHPGPVVGLHPLFGPSTVTLDKQIVVVSPGRDDGACAWLLEQLTLWGSVLVETPAAEHDEIMGLVQAVRHFATFAFGQFLHSRRVSIPRTLELSSPIYRLEMGMVGRLFAQNPTLYAEIIFANPERRALLKDYIRSLNENLALVEKGDKAEFIAQFHKVAEWFGPFSEQAMRESSWLIEKLVHRF
ncbi:MAG: bifunctional chorismate mutase/prephenate dehydrogenase [Verrucomicrobia bacterium]|nr:bifunctional chorismate mutase/prephenate dehydrogenase [Verrucomicrobiota bacterium]